MNEDSSDINSGHGRGDAPATLPDPASVQLLGNIRLLIEHACERVAAAVSRDLTLLYWDIIGERRAEYGKQVISTMSRRLTTL